MSDKVIRRSGPDLAPAVGMVVQFARWNDGRSALGGSQPDDPIYAMTDVDVMRYSDNDGYGLQWMRGQFDIHSIPAPSEPDWARFKPDGAIRAVTPLSPAVGDVCVTASTNVVFWVWRVTTVDDDGAHGVRLPSHVEDNVDDVFFSRCGGLWDSRIIRHANGEWAHGYGPDGPLVDATTGDVRVNPVIEPVAKCKGAPCGMTMANRSRIIPATLEFASTAEWLGDRVYCSPECRDRAKLATTLGELRAATRAIVGASDAPKAPAPWKCAKLKCKTPHAPKHWNTQRCVVCQDGCTRTEMDYYDEPTHPAPQERRRQRALAALGASTLAPGDAHVLAQSGAYRRPVAGYVPLDLGWED